MFVGRGKRSLDCFKDAHTLGQRLISGGGGLVLAPVGRKNSHNSDLLTRAAEVVSPWKMELFGNLLRKQRQVGNQTA